jgi:hypothetical protein
MSKDGQGKWTGEMASIGEELERWEAEHRDATMRDIELRVEQAMAQLGVQIMAELAMTRERRSSGEAVCCPRCEGPTIRRGRRQRQLKGAHDESVVLTRGYVTCQQCGHGFFPSGSGARVG